MQFPPGAPWPQYATYAPVTVSPGAMSPAHGVPMQLHHSTSAPQHPHQVPPGMTLWPAPPMYAQTTASGAMYSPAVYSGAPMYPFPPVPTMPTKFTASTVATHCEQLTAPSTTSFHAAPKVSQKPVRTARHSAKSEHADSGSSDDEDSRDSGASSGRGKTGRQYTLKRLKNNEAVRKCREKNRQQHLEKEAFLQRVQAGESHCLQYISLNTLHGRRPRLSGSFLCVLFKFRCLYTRWTPLHAFGACLADMTQH